jgi:hypothetical protein
MRPAGAALDPADGALMDTVVECDFSLHTCVSKDSSDLFLREFRHPVSVARLTRSMAPLVCVVFDASGPAKVVGFAVQAITVVVRAFHSLRTRAMKSRSNKRVDVKRLGYSVDLEIDTKVAARLMQKGCANDARNTSHRVPFAPAKALAASNSSQVTDHEIWLKADDGFPDFFHVKEHAMNMQQSSNDSGYGVAKNHSVAW